MDKADWVVLRLLRVLLKNEASRAARNRDVVNSVVYLTKKYDMKTIYACITALEDEEKQA